MEENKTIVSEAPKGADASKAGAGKAEPMQKMGDFEDGGKAVTSPTDASSTDHAKKAKKDTSARCYKDSHGRSFFARSRARVGTTERSQSLAA